jgi:hypothetical protein
MLASEFLGAVVAGTASLEGVMFLFCPLVALLGGYAGCRISEKLFSAPVGAA